MSKVKNTLFILTLLKQWAVGCPICFRLYCVTFFTKLRHYVLPQLSYIPGKICLSSTHTTYFEMCPIKGPTRMNQPHCRGAGRRRQQQFECL